MARRASRRGGATGRWYWLRDLLVPQGIDLRLAHAKFRKAIAHAKVKTDAVDSKTVAPLLPTGLSPEAPMIADAHRGPRDVRRARLRLADSYRLAPPQDAPERDERPSPRNRTTPA